LLRSCLVGFLVRQFKVVGLEIFKELPRILRLTTPEEEGVWALLSANEQEGWMKWFINKTSKLATAAR
jgi:hypothetical protein